MKTKKIASTLSRVVGVDSKNALEFEGFKWKMGDTTGANIEYMTDLNDLVKYAHLFIRQIAKDENIDLENIAVSLPTDTYYMSNAKDDGGIVKKLEDEIKKNIKNIKKVLVLPQGVAAVQYLLAKKEIDLKDGHVLVIDGGFNTLNISIIDSKDGDILLSESIYNELGVYNLLNNFFKEELKTKYDEVTSNMQMLKKVFLEERIEAGFNVIDVKKEKQRALQVFIPKLINRVISEVKKGNKSFNQIVFVGGISHYIDKESIETTKKLHIPKEDGEFLTVLGMREIAGEDYDVFDIGFGDTKYILKGKKND